MVVPNSDHAGFVLANSATGAQSCAVKTFEDVRKYAGEEGLSEDQHLEKGPEVYPKARVW